MEQTGKNRKGVAHLHLTFTSLFIFLDCCCPTRRALSLAVGLLLILPSSDLTTLLSMLGPSKNTRARATAAERIVAAQQPPISRLSNAAGFNKLSSNQTAVILGFLDYKNIMISRRVSRKFCDAAKITIVPMYCGSNYRYSEVNLRVGSVKEYNGMRVMTAAVPNLQYLTIGYLGRGHKYIDGEDPDKECARSTANKTTHNIGIISNFRKLRRLDIYNSPLNGRYPSLFNFPLLQVLDIDTSRLKWDLDMLVGLPSLKELRCYDGKVSGNIKSLRVLKRTLKVIRFNHCNNIEGKFTDLADFPRLKSLELNYCSNVAGDIRKLGSSDFPKLTKLELSEGVIGGRNYQFQRVSEVPSVINALYRLIRRDPSPFPNFNDLHLYRTWKLSRDSPDWYDAVGQQGMPSPPHTVGFVRVGTRLGWRWLTSSYGTLKNSCEIQWLDPEPGRESSGYEDYIRELESIQDDIFCFEGYDQPPTAEEYNQLCEEYYGI